jgi:hypothetical protein
MDIIMETMVLVEVHHLDVSKRKKKHHRVYAR